VGVLATLLLGTRVAAIAAMLAADAPPGSYVVGQPVDAVEQPESKTVVDRLERGKSYPLLKRGGPGGAWCKLETPKGEGWVLCARAAEEVAPAAAKPQSPVRWSGNGKCATACEVEGLFARAPPQLTAADREVLQMCPARPDASVSRGDVQRFFEAHLDDPRLEKALSAAGRPGDREAAVEWLTSLWVGSGPRNAFTHVFCGDDWGRESIGGLHWLPRYAQLESEHKVCYAGPVRRGGVLWDGVYLFKFTGVMPWSCAVKEVGGITVQHDPVTIVAVATRAFVRCCPRSGKTAVGVYAASDVGHQRWRIACGTRNGTYGIATFYPVDDTPTCGE